MKMSRELIVSLFSLLGAIVFIALMKIDIFSNMTKSSMPRVERTAQIKIDYNDDELLLINEINILIDKKEYNKAIKFINENKHGLGGSYNKLQNQLLNLAQEQNNTQAVSDKKKRFKESKDTLLAQSYKLIEIKDYDKAISLMKPFIDVADEEYLSVFNELTTLRDNQYKQSMANISKQSENRLKASQSREANVLNEAKDTFKVIKSDFYDNNSSTSMTIIKEAPVSINVWPNIENTPSIIIRCVSNKPEVIFYIGSSFDIENEHKAAEIILTIDKAKLPKQYWKENYQFTGAIAPDPYKLLKIFYNASNIEVSFRPFNREPTRIILDIFGIKQHLEEFSTYCDWSPLE
jgi:hypothetical protein